MGEKKHSRNEEALKKARIRGLSVIAAGKQETDWSPRQESNLYLALRRRPFYPLNYGEGDDAEPPIVPPPVGA